MVLSAGMLATVLLPLLVMAGVATFGEDFLHQEEGSVALNRVRSSAYTAVAASFFSLMLWLFASPVM